MTRPFALSVAGFDPSAGAGVLADCKTMEANKVYGLGIVSAITYQTEDHFEGLTWVPAKEILQQHKILSEKYRLKFVKIGLVENLDVLGQLIGQIRTTEPDAKIVWDPVLKASAGFTFHTSVEVRRFEEICAKVTLITPNLDEIKSIYPELDPLAAGRHLSAYCNVLLKGGHSADHPGKDFLFEKSKVWSMNPASVAAFGKHGSGCVLSAAIIANLAKGNTVRTSCLRSKNYIGKFLTSNKGMLGYHKL